jgi:four helix bundle protein
MGSGVRRFTQLRAWQACDAYKKAVYRVCSATTIATDHRFRQQLEESASGPSAHVAEGFGRFSPRDFARYLAIARASLIESQNHLLDAVDRQHITETQRVELHALSDVAVQEVTALMRYLRSPEAVRNARTVRERVTPPPDRCDEP